MFGAWFWWTLCLVGRTLAASAEIILLYIVTSYGAVACSWLLMAAPALFLIYIVLGWGTTGGGIVFYSSYYSCCLCWGMANGLPWGAFRWCSALLACENGFTIGTLGMIALA